MRRTLNLKKGCKCKSKKIVKSESDIIRHDLRNFLLQHRAKLTGKVNGWRSGKTGQEVFTTVHTIGNEGVVQ